MDLPVMPPVLPMLAKPAKASAAFAPATAEKLGGLAFEPKWDGFRCLVFKDGDEIELASRNTKPLTRYFPEVVEAMRAQLPDRCVLDGELFVAVGDRLQFEVLQERIHPAASRITRLSQETPAEYVAFDLLALGADDLTGRPYAERRELLAMALAGLEELAPVASVSDLTGRSSRVHLTRITTDPTEAATWFERFEGAGLDGVIAKPMGAPYEPNKRTMLKVKHERTADVVLAGYRLHKTSTDEAPLVGSLLLGLWTDEGLQHIGVAASFTAQRRAELVEELAPLVCDLADHPWGRWQVGLNEGGLTANPDRTPGTQSRWSQGKDLSFVPLRPERVIEVGYDHMEGRRFRHTAQFKRWREDRDPESCGYDQLDEPVSYDLSEVLSG